MPTKKEWIEMMAFCGLNCSECPAYKGTVSSDLQLLEETAKKWSDKEDTYTARDMLCLGCTQSDNRLVSSFCTECPIRACASERKVVNCGACPDYDGCEKISKFLTASGKPTLIAKMKLMREKILAS